MTTLLSGIQAHEFNQNFETKNDSNSTEPKGNFFSDLIEHFSGQDKSKLVSNIEKTASTVADIAETGRSLLSATQTNEKPSKQSEISELQSELLAALKLELIQNKKSDNTVQQKTSASNSGEAEKVSENKTLEQLSFGENGLDMGDAFDALNVLNHIPLVSDIYSSINTEEISRGSKLAGSYLVGGPAGLLFSSLDMITEGATGKSIIENVTDAATSFFKDYSTTIKQQTGNQDASF